MRATTTAPRGPQRRPTRPATTAAAGRPFAPALADAVRRGVATLRLWRERAEERRRLAEFPDYLLKDMGLTRVQAQTEARKPFWRA